MLARMYMPLANSYVNPQNAKERLHKKEDYAAASTAIGIATDAVTSVPTATPHLT